MAIAEDAASPAAVHSVNATYATTVTTASFTPGGARLLVVMASFDGTATGTATTLTITDSQTLTWTLLKRTNAQSGTAPGGTSEVWVADYVSGAITVSAKQAGTAATGHGNLVVKALSGALGRVAQTGATGGGILNTGNAASITTTVTGSHVYGALLNFDAAVAMTANGTSALVDSFNDSGGGDTWTAIKALADTGTPGAVSIGVTNTAFHGEIALAEILATAGATNYPRPSNVTSRAVFRSVLW